MFKMFIILERCEIDCGEHGECSGKVCVCSEGWSGKPIGKKIWFVLANKRGDIISLAKGKEKPLG